MDSTDYTVLGASTQGSLWKYWGCFVARNPDLYVSADRRDHRIGVTEADRYENHGNAGLRAESLISIGTWTKYHILMMDVSSE
jgi:hypothetical protein